jgi:hypothetical protein
VRIKQKTVKEIIADFAGAWQSCKPAPEM